MKLLALAACSVALTGCATNSEYAAMLTPIKRKQRPRQPATKLWPTSPSMVTPRPRLLQ